MSPVRSQTPTVSADALAHQTSNRVGGFNYFLVPLVIAVHFLIKKFLIPNFDLKMVENPGLIGGVDLPGFFDGLVILILLFVFAILYFRSFGALKSNLGFVLIIGGAIANLLDRLADGTVTDYVNIGISTVNISDIAIIAGMLIIIIQSVKQKTQKYTQKSEDF